jgi:hypothetical protein
MARHVDGGFVDLSLLRKERQMAEQARAESEAMHFQVTLLSTFVKVLMKRLAAEDVIFTTTECEAALARDMTMFPDPNNSDQFCINVKEPEATDGN